jgi:hypothetical protein
VCVGGFGFVAGLEATDRSMMLSTELGETLASRAIQVRKATAHKVMFFLPAMRHSGIECARYEPHAC